MSKASVVVLRVLLAGMFSGCVIAQLLAGPLGGAVVSGADSVVLSVPLVAAGLCVEVVLDSVRVLAGMASNETMFDSRRRADGWANITVAALAVAALAASLGFAYFIISEVVSVAPSEVRTILALVLLGAAVVAAALALVVELRPRQVSHPDPPRHGTQLLERKSTGRQAWRRVLVGAGLLMLGSVPVAAFVVISLVKNQVDALGAFTLVLGTWIPTTLELSAVIAAAGPATLFVGVFWAPPPKRRWPYSLRLSLAIALTIIVPFSLLAMTVANSSGYRILPGASDGGCRIAVREDGFGGTIGIVQPASVTVGWVGDFDTDDGYDPFQNGTYTLTWHNRTGQLTIDGTTGNPARSGH